MKKISILLLFFFSGIFVIQSQVPELVKSISGDNFRDFTEYNNKTYFISNNHDLWVTDGSTDNTQMVTTLGTGYSYIKAVHLNKIYLDVSGSLWVSNGTEAGTTILRTGFQNIFSKYISIGNLLFFRASTAATGDEWWVTDGTVDGTHITKDVNPGTYGQDTNTKYISYHNKLYFYGYTEAGGRDFWVSDGTEEGTYILSEVNYSGSVLLDYEMTIYNDKIYFTFHDLTNGIELWVSDGTGVGTKLLKNCNTGSNNGYVTSFNVLDNKLLFIAYNGNDNGSRYLWSTDGTATNTLAIKKINIIGGTDTEWINYNNFLFFNGLDEYLGEELFVTDGTVAGTHIVKDISLGSSGSSPEKLTVVNNKIIFYAYDNVNGSELWVSDGTESGTTILKDIYPGIKPSQNYDYIYTIGNKAYFIAKTGLNNFQLIESDATTAGTKVLTPLNVSITSSPLGEGTISNKLHKNFGVLYFKANFNNDGNALYKLGTPILGDKLGLFKEQFLIYPNPSTNFINIKVNPYLIGSRFTITDILGKIVLVGKLLNETSSINIEQFSKGMYFFKIGGQSEQTFKIIKE